MLQFVHVSCAVSQFSHVLASARCSASVRNIRKLLTGQPSTCELRLLTSQCEIPHLRHAELDSRDRSHLVVLMGCTSSVQNPHARQALSGQATIEISERMIRAKFLL